MLLHALDPLPTPAFHSSDLSHVFYPAERAGRVGPWQSLRLLEAVLLSTWLASALGQQGPPLGLCPALRFVTTDGVSSEAAHMEP